MTWANEKSIPVRERGELSLTKGLHLGVGFELVAEVRNLQTSDGFCLPCGEALREMTLGHREVDLRIVGSSRGSREMRLTNGLQLEVEQREQAGVCLPGGA
jgi:hypothetical protein